MRAAQVMITAATPKLSADDRQRDRGSWLRHPSRRSAGDDAMMSGDDEIRRRLTRSRRDLALYLLAARPRLPLLFRAIFALYW